MDAQVGVVQTVVKMISPLHTSSCIFDKIAESRRLIRSKLGGTFLQQQGRWFQIGLRLENLPQQGQLPGWSIQPT